VLAVTTLAAVLVLLLMSMPRLRPWDRSRRHARAAARSGAGAHGLAGAVPGAARHGAGGPVPAAARHGAGSNALSATNGQGAAAPAVVGFPDSGPQPAADAGTGAPWGAAARPR
jgi:hypothetical protein